MARPREFDSTEVVNAALRVFWRDGFRHTSLEALEKETGLNRSSLYNSFGSKDELFCLALDAYRDGPCAALHRPLHASPGAQAIRGYLKGLTAFLASPLAANGCLMIKTHHEGASTAEVEKRVSEHFESLHQLIERAYRRGKREDEVNSDVSPRDAADFVIAVVRGVLTAAARNGLPVAPTKALAHAGKYLEVG